MEYLRAARSYAIILTGLFLFVGTITASHHEMWRDEIQAWLTARDSSSFIDLFRNLKYQGHPGLWYIFLLPLTRITPSPIVMQAFHLLIAAMSVYLFVRYSPFTRLQKFLFSFGYFSIYEYSILCRNYALGVLLLCLFCVLFQQRYAKFLWVGAVLFLLEQTSVHALIIAIGIGCALLADYLLRRKEILTDDTVHRRHIWLGFSLIALGAILSVWQLIPPADSGFAVGWKFRYNAAALKHVIQLMTRAFFPVPQAKLDFWEWESGWLEQYPLFTKIQFPLSSLLVVWCSLVLRRKPIALLTYLTGTIGLLSFFYLKHFGEIRQHGFLFVLFIIAAWIYRDAEEAKGFTRGERPGSIWEKSINPVLTFILIFHVIGGITAVRMDIRYVFSYGKAAAEFIKAGNMQEMVIVGERDSAVSTIVGYLQRKQVYYPRGDRFGSFIIFDKARTDDVSDAQVVQKAKELGMKSKQDVLIILTRDLPRDLTFQSSLTELARFTGSTVQSEKFYLYLMRWQMG